MSQSMDMHLMRPRCCPSTTYRNRLRVGPIQPALDVGDPRFVRFEGAPRRLPDVPTTPEAGPGLDPQARRSERSGASPLISVQRWTGTRSIGFIDSSATIPDRLHSMWCAFSRRSLQMKQRDRTPGCMSTPDHSCPLWFP